MRVRLADIRDRIHAVRTFLDPPLGSDAQPLDIRAAVVDAIDSRVAVLDVGRTVFPYNRILVQLITGPGREKAALALAFSELERKVRERLRQRRCEVPHALQISVSITDEPASEWAPGQLFSIACDDVDALEPEPPPVWPLITLDVLKGNAMQTTYSFRQATILVGRSAEALDTKGRVRRNHVVFDDGSGTVSRAHATLKYDAAHAQYRVVDERSTRGTHVVRAGATIAVPRDSRGIRLESGDEVHLGGAALRVTIA